MTSGPDVVSWPGGKCRTPPRRTGTRGRPHLPGPAARRSDSRLWRGAQLPDPGTARGVQRAGPLGGRSFGWRSLAPFHCKAIALRAPHLNGCGWSPLFSQGSLASAGRSSHPAQAHEPGTEKDGSGAQNRPCAGATPSRSTPFGSCWATTRPCGAGSTPECSTTWSPVLGLADIDEPWCWRRPVPG